MKRILAGLLLTLSLTACTTAIVARPPRAGMVLVEGVWVVPPRPYAVWVPGHYERAGYYHRVWVAGHWRY
jgi:hypothetical protein